MLSRFHRILRVTDRRTDRQTDKQRCYINKNMQILRRFDPIYFPYRVQQVRWNANTSCTTRLSETRKNYVRSPLDSILDAVLTVSPNRQ